VLLYKQLIRPMMDYIVCIWRIFLIGSICIL
jgi:hypothetical protein